MEPIEEARHYLEAADQLRKMPFPAHWGLAEFEQRKQEIFQLHIRALVAVAPSIERVVTALERATERLDRGED